LHGKLVPPDHVVAPLYSFPAPARCNDVQGLAFVFIMILQRPVAKLQKEYQSSIQKLSPDDYASACLMSGEDKHLGYLNVFRCIGSIYRHVCNVIARQRLNALIDSSSTFVVTMKANVTEVVFLQVPVSGW